MSRVAWLAFGLPACVSVLALDDYDDAIIGLCRCDTDVPQFDGRCVDVLKARLDSVSEPTREQWLTFYADQCHGECTNAAACFQNVGTCAQRSCTEHRECCDYREDGGTRCIEAECAACRPLDAECTEDTDCCDPTARCTSNVCTG